MPNPTPKFTAFHWPDHVIGKRESRRIRDEHNALYNSHAELLTALKKCEHVIGMAVLQGKLPDCALSPVNDALVAARSALDNTKGGDK